MDKKIQYSINDFDISLAKQSDIMDVDRLSNDFVVRENSFNSKSISLDDHIEWFNEKIKSEESLFFVVRDLNGMLVAQVRFDRIVKKSDDYIITIHLDAKRRGSGLGTFLLSLISNKLINEFNAKKIIAYVKPMNVASKKIFLKVGYVLVGKEVINGLEAFKFKYSNL